MDPVQRNMSRKIQVSQRIHPRYQTSEKAPLIKYEAGQNEGVQLWWYSSKVTVQYLKSLQLLEHPLVTEGSSECTVGRGDDERRDKSLINNVVYRIEAAVGQIEQKIAA